MTNICTVGISFFSDHCAPSPQAVQWSGIQVNVKSALRGVSLSPFDFSHEPTNGQNFEQNSKLKLKTSFYVLQAVIRINNICSGNDLA